MTSNQQPGPRIGAVVKDTGTERIGVVVGAVGGRIQLRPLRGGLEWDAEWDSVEVLSPRQELTARLAALNAESRRSV